MIAEKMKKSILQAAIQGKLTQRESGDGTAAELLQQIAAEKAKLIKEGKIKKEKPLPEISEAEKPFDLPEGWEWCRLGDISTFHNGDRSSNYPKKVDLVSSGIPFFGASDMGIRTFKNSVDLRYITQKKFNELRSGKLIDRDVVILLRGSVGKACIFISNDQYKTGFINAQMLIVRFIMKTFVEFFMIYLETTIFQIKIKESTTGTAIAQIPAEVVRSFLFPVPPIEEQQRIVACVEEMVSQVESLSKDEKKLDALQSTMPERLKASLLQAAIQGKLTERLPGDGNAEDLLAEIAAEKQWLIKAKKIKKEKPLPEITEEEKPFELPDGWAWCRLGAICNYGTNESVSPDKLLKGRLLIDLEDIEKNTGKLINHKIYNGKNANSNKNLFYAGNVLYSKLRPYLNKVILADEDGYCTSEILPLDFGKHIYNKYAQILLMSPEFLNYANQCSYGVKMPRLGTKDARIFTCPIPPLAEQQRIVQRLEELLPLCEGILSGK